MSVPFWLDSLARDVVLGARMLRKHSVVSAAATLSLALALGACLAAFSLVDALVLRPLPVRNPAALFYLAYPTDDPERPESETFNDPLFLQLRQAARGRADLFVMSTQVLRPVLFEGAGDEKEQLRTQYVSGDAFERLGIHAAAGRVIAAADDVTVGAHPYAVISHAFWTRRFGNDPAVVGRSFVLGETRFQIVGVAEPRFAGVEPGRPTDLWLPYAMGDRRSFGSAQYHWFRVFGRLRDGVEREAVAPVLQAAFSNFRRDYARRVGRDGSPESFARFVGTPLWVRSAETGPSPLRRQFGRPLWVLASIAMLVLLIAGSNVANLFLARGASREREMALRLSIGAGRRRLIQQVVVESGLLAVGASMLGVAFSAMVAPAIVRMLGTPGDPILLELPLDARVAVLAAGLMVLTTMVFGLPPAVRASSTAPFAALKPGGARAAGGSRAMRPFIAMQIAFGLMVLLVGALFVRSFARLSAVNPGYATDVLLLSLEPTRRVEPERQRAALRDVLERLRSVRGVTAAASAEFNALGRAWTQNLRIPGTVQRTIEATVQPVTPGYFEAMRIPLRAGRTFDRRELDVTASTVIVVNEAFVRGFSGSVPAIGQLVPTRFFQNDTGPYEIVGVVADTRYDLRRPAAPVLYLPLPLRTHGTIHVRAAGDPLAIASRLREEVRAASPLLRVTTITTQSAAVARTLVRERLLAMLSGFFAVVGLVLAAVGLYGVLTYSVLRRTREIGIRLALGARAATVVRHVISETARPVVVGVLIGLAGGFYLSRFVRALLFEVTPLDFWSLALPLATLLFAAVVAATIPALRATRVDPAIALRSD